MKLYSIGFIIKPMVGERKNDKEENGIKYIYVRVKEYRIKRKRRDRIIGRSADIYS